MDSHSSDRAVDPAILGGRVELQLFTTLQCNLKCTYCSIALGEVRDSQGPVQYTLEALDRFVDTHLQGKEIYVTFYGGEPTLNIPFIESVMARYPSFRFQLQTNGTLLNRVPDAVLAGLSNILVSVDGGRGVTDDYRGRGVYARVMRNLRKVRGRVGGTLTARMTWSHPDTSFEEIDALTESFDYVYWQFAHWEQGYEPEAMARKKAVIARLVGRFFESTGRLYPLIPVMGVVRNKLLPDRMHERTGSYSQCRVSTHLVNVLPDGRIFACPDMAHVPAMQQGDIFGNWLKRSPLQPHPAMPCEGCEAYSYCRRNCMKNLYVAYVEGDSRYREKVVEPVCELVRALGREVDRHNPARWYARAAHQVRRTLAECEVYDYVEVMP